MHLAPREQLVELRPGRELPRVHRQQVVRGVHLDELVVVAAEDVERLRRGDRLLDHRHRVGDGQGELEAEVSLGLLLDLRRRPLDAERDHAQRAGELAGLAGLRRRSAGQRSRTGDRGRGNAALDEEIAASHATLLVCGLGAGQTLVLTDLGREFTSVDFELRHEPNSFLLAALPRI